jgi:hypothetical protein
MAVMPVGRRKLSGGEGDRLGWGVTVCCEWGMVRRR